jgi:exosortase
MSKGEKAANNQHPCGSKDRALTKPGIFLLSVLGAAFVVTYFPVWKRLVGTWMTSDEYSHGFLIVPLCCYIIWKNKENLSKIAGKPSGWGLALSIFSLLIYIFAHFAEILTLASFSMVLLMAGIAIYLYGFKFCRSLTFPLFLLLFMIPVPAQIYSSLTIPLQLFVSKVSVGISGLIGLPIYREGNIIHLPEQTLQVVQACSGLRSIVALLTLSVVFGYFTLKSNILRTFLFLSGIPVAIFVNIIRVLLMVLAFYYFKYDLTAGTTHTLFGLLIFGLALLSIYFIRGALFIWDRSSTEE